MTESQMTVGIPSMFGLQHGQGGSHGAGEAGVDVKKLERFMATGLGSRGGPNKISNKLKRSPMSYLLRNAIPLEYLMATGLRSRGGPNKATNKLRSRLSSYLYD